MQYRRLGSSDLVVSAIGFGCWEIGGGYGHVDDDDAVAAIRLAVDRGITLFDTAKRYGEGRSERLLSRALGSWRKDVVLATKCGRPERPDGTVVRDSSYGSIMAECEASLKALDTDYIDLYLIHWPDPDTPLEESMRAFNDLRQAGKVRYVGVSNFRSELLREAARYAPICANQVGYNLFDRRWEREMFPTARELGVGIMSYGSLAHGLLTGTFTPETRFDGDDWRQNGTAFGQPILEGDNYLRNLEVVEQLKGVARRKGTSLARLALAWVLSNPLVGVALCGMRAPAEVEDNVAAADVALDDAERAELEGIMQGAAGLVDAVPT